VDAVEQRPPTRLVDAAALGHAGPMLRADDVDAVGPDLTPLAPPSTMPPIVKVRFIKIARPTR